MFVRLGLRALRSGVRRSYCGYESKNLCARRGVLVPLIEVSTSRRSRESEREPGSERLEVGRASRAGSSERERSGVCAGHVWRPRKSNHWIDVF